MALPAIALHGKDDSPAHGPALLDGGNFQQMGHDIAGCDLFAAVRGSVDQCMSRGVSAGDVVRDVGQDVSHGSAMRRFSCSARASGHMVSGMTRSSPWVS